jgi:hypothetical protein
MNLYLCIDEDGESFGYRGPITDGMVAAVKAGILSIYHIFGEEIGEFTGKQWLPVTVKKEWA